MLKLESVEYRRQHLRFHYRKAQTAQRRGLGHGGTERALRANSCVAWAFTFPTMKAPRGRPRDPFTSPAGPFPRPLLTGRRVAAVPPALLPSSRGARPAPARRYSCGNSPVLSRSSAGRGRRCSRWDLRGAWPPSRAAGPGRAGPGRRVAPLPKTHRPPPGPGPGPGPRSFPFSPPAELRFRAASCGLPPVLRSVPSFRCKIPGCFSVRRRSELTGGAENEKMSIN